MKTKLEGAIGQISPAETFLARLFSRWSVWLWHLDGVDTHRSQVMKQLDIHEIAGLVRYALRTGLISSDN